MLYKIIDDYGLITICECNNDAHLIAIRSPYGQTTKINLRNNKYIAAVTNSSLETVRFDCDNNGLITGIVDANGNITRCKYDSVGRLIEHIDATGALTKFSTQTTGKAWSVEVKTPEERTITYTNQVRHDGSLMCSESNGCGMTRSIEKCMNGTIVSSDPDGTRETQIVSPDPCFGMEAPMSGMTVIETQSGLRKTIEYEKYIDPVIGKKIIDTVFVNSNISTLTFDSQLQQFIAASPMGRKHYRYTDAHGRVLLDSIPGTYTTHYVYDEHGFMTKKQQGDRVTSYVYDATGQLIKITNPLGHVTKLTYDGNGRIIQQIFPDGRDVTYTYDNNGNLSTIMPGSGPHQFFVYDPLNKLIRSATCVDTDTMDVWRYEYNHDQQLVRMTLPDGDQIEAQYDSLNCGHPSKIVFDRGVKEIETDAKTGHIKRIISAKSDTLRFEYDGFLPIRIGLNGTINGTIDMEYNDDFRIASEIVNEKSKISYAYDDDGLLTRVGELSIKYSMNNNQIMNTSMGKLTTRYEYNSFNEISECRATYLSSDLFQSACVYDKSGRLVELNETMLGEAQHYRYFYDESGQLTRTERNGTLVSSYKYDPNGNRIRQLTMTDTIISEYSKLGRLIRHGTTEYVYKQNGSLQRKIQGQDTTWYGYDDFGNLVYVLLPNHNELEYIIDGCNRRIARKINGVLQARWLYLDSRKLVAELDSVGNVVSRFVYSGSGNNPDYMVKHDKTYRVISDCLGNIRLIVDITTGEVVQRVDYDAFGNITMDSNSGFQPFGYGGGLYESTTGLILYPNGDYDPETGRWTAPIQTDPFQMILNPYCFRNNDPINGGVRTNGFVPGNCNMPFCFDEIIDFTNLVRTTVLPEKYNKALMFGTHECYLRYLPVLKFTITP
ncbi:RHS repeat protein [candidate division KSB1 bacterium]|nr:RHS repeat protein [candidate division KSB1 bacterium]